MTFEIKKLSDPKLKEVILLEGLPGIGNVGKIAIDFMIDDLKAKKIMEIHSSSFPNSVFVNENNLVNLPIISLYHKKIKNKDFIFLAGDIQPLDERACYDFCNLVIDIFKKYKGKEIITLGGIGMPKIPKTPSVYCTANDHGIIKRYKTKELNDKIFGTVGPIMGVTGLLIGLAGKHDIPSIALLAQTFGHPNYLGIKGANEILKLLNKKFSFNLNLKELEKEIKEIEEVNIKAEKKISGDKLKEVEKILNEKTSYIG